MTVGAWPPGLGFSLGTPQSSSLFQSFLSYFYFLFPPILGVEFRALFRLGKNSTVEPCLQPPAPTFKPECLRALACEAEGPASCLAMFCERAACLLGILLQERQSEGEWHELLRGLAGNSLWGGKGRPCPG